MYRIIIGDTDINNINNIKRYIKDNYQDKYKIINAYTDFSPKYLEIIRKDKPDLLIGDFRFFGINASMIIAGIHQTFPELKFIIYGNLSEKEYLERYLDLGALSYMFKPLKPSTLNKHLDLALGFLDKQKQREEESLKIIKGYKENENLFENMFLINLINGIIVDPLEIDMNLRYFNLNLKNNYTVIEVKVDHFQRLNLALEPEDKHILIYGVLKATTDILIDYNAKAFISAFNVVTVILSNEDDNEKIYNIGEMIKNNIYNKDNIKVTVGIGRTYEDINKVSSSYNEAVIALSHRYYLGYNSVIPVEFAQPQVIINFNYYAIKEEKISFAASVGEFETCKKHLDDIFSSLRDREPLPERLVSQIVVEIMISISRYITEQNILKDTNLSEFFPTNEALKINTANEGYTFLYNNLQRFCEHVVREREKEDKVIVERAKKYIEQRYYESISTFKTALVAKTTPDYLSKLFLEYEKESIYEYYINKRMNVAKEFLINTDMGDDDIAVNVGYSNGRHFKAVFRQYVGMETEEYRIRNR